ncbi:MAG: hypothetical protein ABIC40_02965, partial [bacterium]
MLNKKNAITAILAVSVAVLFPGITALGCNKTAANTNKPVIITDFKFVVDGQTLTPEGVLQIKPGNVLSITVEYSDPDAGDNPNPAWYKFTWTVEQLNETTPGFNPNDDFISYTNNPCIWGAPDVNGFFRFRCEVKDKYNDSSIEMVVVEVNANRNPVITKLEISDNQPFINEEVTITVQAKDPDNNLPLEYVWEATGGFFSAQNEGMATWASPVAGNFTISLKVKDQAGGNIERSIPLTVQANHDPVIAGWTLDPDNSIEVNGLVTITLSVSDQDNDSLEFNWTADCGSFKNVNENTAIWRAPSAVGSCTINIE